MDRLGRELPDQERCRAPFGFLGQAGHQLFAHLGAPPRAHERPVEFKDSRTCLEEIQLVPVRAGFRLIMKEQRQGGGALALGGNPQPGGHPFSPGQELDSPAVGGDWEIGHRDRFEAKCEVRWARAPCGQAISA